MGEMELKACPFCGGTAALSIKECGTLGRIWYVRCVKCNVRSDGWREPSELVNYKNPYAKVTETVENAIAEWNRRADDERDQGR